MNEHREAIRRSRLQRSRALFGGVSAIALLGCGNTDAAGSNAAIATNTSPGSPTAPTSVSPADPAPSATASPAPSPPAPATPMLPASTTATGAPGPSNVAPPTTTNAPIVPSPAPDGSSTVGGSGGAPAPTPPAAGGNENPAPAAGGAASPGQPNATVPHPIVSHIFTADPSAHVFEGRIYVYASHDPDDQAAYDMVDYHVFSSNDLANWQDHGVVLDAADIPFASKLYAPDCVYDARSNKYYLYFPDAGSTIGVATSDDPGGPFTNPIQLVTAQTPGVSDVDWIFDPSVFIDDDGQAYLYFGGGQPDTGDNARVIRLGDDMVSLKDTSATTIVAPDFFEASFTFKRDGTYYFSYSTTYAEHAPTIDYMVSDNPMTGFEFVGTVIPSPDENNGDNNHHSMVEYEGQWYVFYHNRVLANRDGYSNYQRSITLDKLSWSDDGRMNPVSSTRGEVRQLRSVDAFSRIEAELIAGQSGIETDFAMEGATKVGVAVTDLQDGDWLAVSQVDFGDGADTFAARITSTNTGTIEILQGGCSDFRTDPGTPIGTCAFEPTGGMWTDMTCAVNAAAGVHDLCLRFTGVADQLLSLDHYRFE